MMNGEMKFCRSVDELAEFIEKDGELKVVFEGFDLKPEEVLECLRNYMGHYVTSDFEVLDLLRHKLSSFLRREFEYLSGDENCCAERKFKELLEMVAGNDYNHFMPVLLKQWDRWFAPDDNVRNEMYETYDFTRSENVILYVIKTFELPPFQAEYVEYYLKMKRAYVFTDYELEILRSASANLLSHESEMCKRFDEIIKS